MSAKIGQSSATRLSRSQKLGIFCAPSVHRYGSSIIGGLILKLSHSKQQVGMPCIVVLYPFKITIILFAYECDNEVFGSFAEPIVVGGRMDV